MDEQLCQVVKYLYRRDRMPGSIQWHMNSYIVSDSPAMRVPGFVEEAGSADELSILVAVPCSPNGEFEPAAQDEYEDLADDQFGQLRPGQELA